MNDDDHNMWELPRRYEETKPALSQAFTHNAIISIGNKLSNEERQRHNEDLHAAVAQCEKETWEKAEIYKNDCVNKALSEAKLLHERNVGTLKKEHSKKLKHELDRLQNYLVHQMEERLNEQLTESNRQQANALDDLRSISHQEKLDAVDAARQEEQNAAHENLTDTKQQHETALEAQHQADLLQKENEFNDIKAQHEEEKNVAVIENTQHHENIMRENINALNNEHNAEVKRLEDIITNLRSDLDDTRLALENMTVLKNSYVAKLIHNKEAFTKFIEAARPDFHPDQADFLGPLNEVLPADDPRL